MRVEIAARCGNEVGESVLWDSEREEVLWVDIERGSILRLEPRSGAVHRSQPDDRIGAIGLREGGGLVLGLASGFALLDSIDGSLERLQTVESDLPTTRLNDGRVDRSGRFICGGMDEAANKQPISAVYRLDPDQQASLDQALVPRRWSPTDSSGTSAAVLRAPTGRIVDTICRASRNARVARPGRREPGVALLRPGQRQIRLRARPPLPAPLPHDVLGAL